MNGSAKCKKMGWFGVVRWHSKSWAMPPFVREHTTSYSTLIETMCLSVTVFEILPVICRKSPILTHPTCIWPPRRGWPRSNFAENFGTRKLDSLSYRVFCLCDPMFSRFSRTPTCDRQTQTDGHIAMASTADAKYRAVKMAKIRTLIML